MAIDWISINERVPDNRRQVLAWGETFTLLTSKFQFLGASRFNLEKDGGKWDCTKTGRFAVCHVRVTHWAEISGPRILPREV